MKFLVQIPTSNNIKAIFSAQNDCFCKFDAFEHKAHLKNAYSQN